MKESKFYVYGLFKPNPDLDRCFYIGKGCEYRMYLHLTKGFSHNNPYKKNKIEKIRRNGKEPYAKKIVDDLTEDKAYELEEFLIKEIGLENLTNLCGGGLGASSGKNNHNYNTSRDKETRRKISKSLKGRSRSESLKEKVSKAHKGKTLSKEHRNNISKSLQKSNNGDISTEIAKEIKWLTNNSNKKHQEIADEYKNATIYIVSDISCGKTHSYLEEKEPNNWNPSDKAKGKWIYKNTDLSQREVAEIFDVSQSSIKRWKNNESIIARNPNNYK